VTLDDVITGTDGSYPIRCGAEESGTLLQRSFVLDRRRQALTDRCALSPLGGQPPELDAAVYFHDANN
jgi:hypothetical protein